MWHTVAHRTSGTPWHTRRNLEAFLDNTEKSRRRRAKARTQGAVRINVELRGDAAKRWSALVETHGGSTQALAYLVSHTSKRTITREDVLGWIRTNTR